MLFRSGLEYGIEGLAAAQHREGGAVNNLKKYLTKRFMKGIVFQLLSMHMKIMTIITLDFNYSGEAVSFEKEPEIKINANGKTNSIAMP